MMLKKPVKKIHPAIDKKGFHVITDDHDLYEIFDADGKGKKKPEDENFAKLLDAYLDDKRQKLLLKEKKQAAQKSKPLTIAEQIKEYPCPQIEIDLHGHTSAEAEKQTEVFVWHSRARGFRTARIIVGKGLHSEKKAVLPDVVETKLIQLKRQKVILDFKWDKGDKRKSGSIIVYLNPI